MMTLKEFIQETLTQITSAITEFAATNKDTGADPNPPLVGSEAGTSHGLVCGPWDETKNRYPTIMPVEFDVAITAEESEAKKAGGSVRVMSLFKADGGIEAGSTTGSVSRVRFKVPLQLPDTGGAGPRRSAGQGGITSHYDTLDQD